MAHFPTKFAKILLLSIVGLAAPLSGGSAQDKPVVLLIARGDAVYGATALERGIDKEANVIIRKLNEQGYAVEVATEDGKDLQAGGSKLKVDEKLADVKVTRYAGVIIPCMNNTTVPASAVKIVQDMHGRGVPVAAQNGGVLILGAAGVLKERNYAISDDLKWDPTVQNGVLKGVGVVQDGDILTSGVCPAQAMKTGLKDGTDELVTTFAAMLKK
jgi:putative intracellular protease/amidase